MKNIYSACLVILCIAGGVTAHADAPPITMPQTIVIDPTIGFFSALSTCTPGAYTEKNDLGADIGQVWLSQIIVGQDSGLCNVTLSTPDHRSMSCAFPLTSLSNLIDQQFLQGIADNNAIAADKNAVNADVVWSQLKTDNCSFVTPEAAQ